ncbi:molybdopterin molybdotransferase MoeA [Corynebacterium minutissimum]|uniref:molybdopterin molybdotransferase MoeA n=1 Tax=Corynebacterium minutissimum TaxID=38301 RepID=UPI001EF31F99|nr:molybdopterin molybdotransferase MoeA [Corynebacterium minutissimum]MCG7229562.1 molybdopterin molybdotransferase MoeA [Corynebacterium minutissimum]MCG7238647.1 molybdopterin molybdotransferase MoeA [Corynebacterium minutissimum]
MTMPGTSIEDYFSRLHTLIRPVSTEQSSVHAGRVLAQTVTARRAIPPQDNSAMDGFLTPPLDKPCTLKVVGDVPAGAAPRTPEPGTAVRIMTGGAIPEGFDGLVIPVEDTDISPGPGPLPETITIHRVPARSHIRRRGSHIACGEEITQSSSFIDAPLLATLLSSGITSAELYRVPRITVIATGEELLNGQLPDSNGPMLEAILHATGTCDITRLCCGDDPNELREIFESATQGATGSDLIVTTGGVSAGAFDVVRDVLTEHGERPWFGHVDQRPGAPQGHALWNEVPVVCLPGNPVAAFVSAHLYLTPLLRTLAGLPRPQSALDRPHLTATAAADFPTASHPLIQPCHLILDGTVTAAPPPGPRMRSHHVGALLGTNVFALITDSLSAGDTLDVYPY